MTLTLSSCSGVGVLRKFLDQYLSTYQTRTKYITGFRNNEFLKTVTQNSLVCDLDLKVMYGRGDGTFVCVEA